MSSSIVQLPCVSHAECTYHKHWHTRGLGQSQSDTETGADATVDRSSDPTTSQTLKYRNSSLQPCSSTSDGELGSLQILPTELLLVIASYLPIIDQASLSITCKSFASALGSLAWEGTSRAKSASWYKHAVMIDLLQRDLEGDQHWRCDECHILHRRRKTVRFEEPKRRSRDLSALSRILTAQNDGRDSSLRFGCLAEPLYMLDSTARKAILDRHFLGAPNGVCLNTLKCSGFRTCTLSETTNMRLHYAVTPKIVLDCLLLHSKYTFTPQRTMFIRNMKITEMSTQDFLMNLDFWICGHQRTGDIVLSAPKDPKKAFGGPLRCPYCPTQYKVSHESRNSISLLVWQNLGSGLSATDSKWQALSTMKKKPKKYKWGKEDFCEAYRRILCSTREEFDRQVEMSDGRGNWYEPELERNGYMTLPIKIAGRLS